MKASMKICRVGLALVSALLLPGCIQQSGSVSPDAVVEMLDSPGLAVTPYHPAWLNEGGEEIWPMSETDCKRVREILLGGEQRHIPELAYQTDDERTPYYQNRFYIYASNGQCLAATWMESRVVMHDVVLPQAVEQELYRLLKPYLAHVFPELK